MNDLLAAADLVRHGPGVCIMPPSLAARFPEFLVRPFAAHAPAWTVGVVYPRGDLSPVVAAFLRHVRQLRAPDE
ncbi:LysR substrate-binding domain-containing protein [Streptomyces sp. NPDC093064]|uniref:LysR substrate-binding domain-containing protein n=1 Tax=unclassified Streptomyces TaxID=2593676 RepID=UPI0036B2042A